MSNRPSKHAFVDVPPRPASAVERLHSTTSSSRSSEVTTLGSMKSQRRVSMDAPSLHNGSHSMPAERQHGKSAKGRPGSRTRRPDVDQDSCTSSSSSSDKPRHSSRRRRRSKYQHHRKLERDDSQRTPLYSNTYHVTSRIGHLYRHVRPYYSAKMAVLQQLKKTVKATNPNVRFPRKSIRGRVVYHLETEMERVYAALGGGPEERQKANKGKSQASESLVESDEKFPLEHPGRLGAMSNKTIPQPQRRSLSNDTRRTHLPQRGNRSSGRDDPQNRKDHLPRGRQASLNVGYSSNSASEDRGARARKISAPWQKNTEAKVHNTERSGDTNHKRLPHLSLQNRSNRFEDQQRKLVTRPRNSSPDSDRPRPIRLHRESRRVQYDTAPRYGTRLAQAQGQPQRISSQNPADQRSARHSSPARLPQRQPIEDDRWSAESRCSVEPDLSSDEDSLAYTDSEHNHSSAGKAQGSRGRMASSNADPPNGK